MKIIYEGIIALDNQPHHIIPSESNTSNKTKTPHIQVKGLSKFSILHWNYIHSRPYTHPCFQVTILTLIDIHHMIRYFTRMKENLVIVTLVGA